MAAKDEQLIQRYEQGAMNLRANAPLVSAAAPLTSPPASSAIRPTSTAPVVAPVARRPIGTEIGQAARAGAQALGTSQLNTLGAGITASSAPLRAVGGFARDAASGFTGAANPQAGQPLSLPSLRSLRSATRPTATAPAGQPFNYSPGPSTRGRPRPVAPAAAPVAAVPAPMAAAAAVPVDGVYRGTDAQGNNVYSDSAAGLATGTALANGQRPTPAPVVAAAAAPAAAPVATPAASTLAARPSPVQPVTAAPAARFSPRGRQGGIIRNPANGTVSDQILRAMSDSRLDGSPSGRRAVAEAIMQENGYQNAERQSALATGDQADLANIRNQADAIEGAQRRDLDAQQFNASLQDRAADRGQRLQEIQLARRPEVTTTADGTMGIVGNDGTFQPVTQGGQPVRAAQAPRQTGELTEGEKLKSYTDRLNAISADVTSKPEDKAAALAALNADPIYNSLRPAGATAGAGQAPPPDAVAMLRGDPSKAAQFDQVFGQGAAARALGR